MRGFTLLLVILPALVCGCVVSPESVGARVKVGLGFKLEPPFLDPIVEVGYAASTDPLAAVGGAQSGYV